MGKSKQSKDSLSELRNAVRGTNGRAALRRIRATASAKDIKQLLAWIHSSPFLRERTLPRAFPRERKELNNSFDHKPLDLNQEINWASMLLLPHREAIFRFRQLAEKAESSILLDNLAEAGRALETIEAEFGQSLWLMKKQLMLLQLSGGIAVQKAFLEGIKQELPQGSIVSFIAHHISARTEPSFTIGRFYSRMAKLLAATPSEVSGYLAYHIAPTPELVRLLPQILSLESLGTIIDLSEALRFSLQLVSGLGHGTPAIENNELFRLLLDLDKRPSDTVGKCVELWLANGEDSAFEQLVALLRKDPLNAEATDLAVLAGATLTETPPQFDAPLALRLLSKRIEIASGRPSKPDDFAELEKFTRPALGQHHWINCALAQMEQESLVDPLARDARLQRMPSLGGLRRNASHAITQTAWPSTIADAGDIELTNTEPHIKDAISLILRGTRSDRLRPEYQTLTLARRCFAKEEYAQALELAESIASTNHPLFRRRAAQMAVECLIRLDQSERATERAVDECLILSAVSSVLPIDELATHLQQHRHKTKTIPVAAAILFDLAARPNGREHDSACVFAVMDAIDQYNVKTPSELGTFINEIGKARLVHLLRNVCIESVIDRTLIFPSSIAVLEQRVAICRVLAEIDAEAPEPYQVEIRALLRRLMLQKRMRQVEQSKIYVDIDSIKRRGTEKLRESIARYFSLRNAPTSTEPKRLVSPQSKLLALPRSESRELLYEIVIGLREEYTTSPEHGLDKYLSVRIRHGTLASHLRRPLESSKLVTLKDPTSETYRPNEHWAKRPQFEPSSTWVLQDRLAKFSGAFDKLVDEIRDWVHITSDTSKNGMFDFIVTEKMLDSIEDRANRASDFDELVATLTEYLDEILRVRLKEIRERLNDHAKACAAKLIDELDRDISNIPRFDEGQLLNTIRGAKTDVLVSIDRLAAWFNRVHTADMDPFPIDDAVEICVQTVQAVAPTFAAKLDTKGLSLFLGGRQFAIFVDVLFIIFDNCARHSGLVEPKVSVTCAMSATQSVEIVVRNSLGEGIDNSALRRSIERVRTDMNAGLSEKSVRQEGGSGLHKLRKILAHDFGAQDAFLFGLSDDNKTFEVSFRVRVTNENTAR